AGWRASARIIFHKNNIFSPLELQLIESSGLGDRRDTGPTHQAPDTAGENMPPHTMESSSKIPNETNTKLRSLAHDLSNSIETIMQASYLLNQGQLDDTSKKWLELVDNAARDAARINREIRDILRNQGS